jgi:hypothetical protein
VTRLVTTLAFGIIAASLLAFHLILSHVGFNRRNDHFGSRASIKQRIENRSINSH